MSADTSLRTMPTYLNGVFIALAGVPDVWVVFDSPPCIAQLVVDCAIGEHAWRQRLLGPGAAVDRIFTTGTKERRGPEGPPPGLVERLQAMREAQGGPPAAVLLSDMVPARLVGNDAERLAEELAEAVGAPCVVVDFISLTRDWLDGFEASMTALVDALPAAAFEVGEGAADSVAAVGYMMDRAEGDHLANVRELERMLEALGLDVRPTWASDRPLRELAGAAGARRLLAFPYGRSTARRIAARSGAEVLDVELPVGVDGTVQWLRAVAAFCGGDVPQRAERLIGMLLPEVVASVSPMVPLTLAGRRVAVIADPAVALPLSGYLEELGVDVVGPIARCRRAETVPPGLRGRSPASVRDHDPTLESLEALLDGAARDGGGDVDLVIGSTWEREMVAPRGVPFMELGYPSLHHRPLTDAPWLGFAGAVHLVERLSAALAEGRYERLHRARRAATRRGPTRHEEVSA